MTRCTPGQSALALQSVRGDFDAAFAGFFWSHVPLAEIDGFLEALMLRLLPGSLVVFGGDNGGLATQILSLKDKHPGFSLKTLRLHDSTWSTISQLPLSLVTTGATYWKGQIVIAGGENQPGHRSNRVIGSGKTH